MTTQVKPRKVSGASITRLLHAQTGYRYKATEQRQRISWAEMGFEYYTVRGVSVAAIDGGRHRAHVEAAHVLAAAGYGVQVMASDEGYVTGLAVTEWVGPHTIELPETTRAAMAHAQQVAATAREAMAEAMRARTREAFDAASEAVQAFESWKVRELVPAGEAAEISEQARKVAEVAGLIVGSAQQHIDVLMAEEAAKRATRLVGEARNSIAYFEAQLQAARDELAMREAEQAAADAALAETRRRPWVAAGYTVEEADTAVFLAA